VPTLAGTLSHRRGRDDVYTLGALTGYVRNEGTAWQLAMRSVMRLSELVASQYSGTLPTAEELPTTDPLELVGREPPTRVQELLAPFDESMELLGRRTAELHLLLAKEVDDPNFGATPFTQPYQRSLYQGMRSLAKSRLRQLRRAVSQLDQEARPQAEALLSRESELLARFGLLRERRIEVARTRSHGNLHLANVLNTGKDFVIVNFFGEEDRPLSERRIKRSPLRDVAGILQSMEFASQSLRMLPGQDAALLASLGPHFERWTEVWSVWNSAAFLTTYLSVAGKAAFIPSEANDLRRLLNLFQLEKVVRHLNVVLLGESRWLSVALRSIERLLDQQA
jgi:maltose alpha-D-glucosyltransferase / alpha-amylase